MSNTRILAISGGGVWGAGVAHFLDLLSKHTAESAEYFEGFAGTSTGAIIAACLAHGVDSEEISDLYRSEVKKIFTKNPWYKRMLPSTPRYTNREFRKVLEKVFGNTRMCDLKKACWLVAWRTNGESNNKVFDRSDDVLVVDAVMASAAAPTYFPVHAIGKYEYMDGGLWANNPALCALAGCNTHPDGVKLLTLVTGGTQVNRKTGNMGLLKLAKYLGVKLITGRVTGTDFIVRDLVKDSFTVCPTEVAEYDLDDVGACSKIRRIWEKEYRRVDVILRKFLNDL